MELLPDATAGLYTAVVSGLFGVLIWWLRRRDERPARADAQQRQMEALRDELRTANAARVNDLLSRIAEQDRDLDSAHAEVRRLNRLLNRQQRGGND